MKKQYFLLAVGALLLGSANAQTTIIDTIETGAGYANDVYYSMQNGEVASVANSDWNLGFSIGNTNVSVRANTGVNSANNGKTVMYRMPGSDLTKWSTFDTTGYKTGSTKWAVVNNSDIDWQEGALNQVDTLDMIDYDYGWGAYDPSTHAITAVRLYMAEITDGANKVYKKVIIQSKIMGTWKVSFANLDGTDSVGVTIVSSSYSTKNFVYVSLVTGQVVDREPAKTSWDFVYTRYLPNTPGYPTVTGILTKEGITVSEVRGIEENNTTLADTGAFSAEINTIGSDWKTFNGTMYVMADSLTYFVKSTGGAYWKLVFTGFSSSTGQAILSKTKLTPNTGIATIGEEVKNLTVYPNPAQTELTVLFEAQSSNSRVVMTDLTGKEVYNQVVASSMNTIHKVDVSSLNKGIYFLNVINGNSRSVQKVVVN